MSHSLALKDLKLSEVIPGNINTTKHEILVPLKENTAHLWRIVITKTYKDIITEPRERGDISERRFSVIERRNSVASCLRSSGLRRRNGGVGLSRGMQERINTVLEESKTSFTQGSVDLLSMSRQRKVKVTI